ncbi:hypothetical protein OAO01_07905 [Oligoflexia bacterium]|nr:hypothetical protein [Oligoflexia bacterium]
MDEKEEGKQRCGLPGRHWISSVVLPRQGVELLALTDLFICLGGLLPHSFGDRAIV